MQGSESSFYTLLTQSPHEQASQPSHVSQSTQFAQTFPSQHPFSVQNTFQPIQLQQPIALPYGHPFQVSLLAPQSQETSQRKKSSRYKDSSKTTQKKRTRNFTHKEDEALVRAWIAISGDGIIGNSQSGTTLWNRIYNTFNELLGIQNPEEDADRSPNSLACRWTAIQHQVNKFCGHFATIERNPISGSNFDKWVEDAKAAFRGCEKSEFKMENLWRILRDNAKWNEKNVAPKRKHNSEESSSSKVGSINIDSSPQSNLATPGLTTENEERIERPKIGRKKGKELTKNGGIKGDRLSSKAINEFMEKLDASVQQQIAISEKDMKCKEEMYQKDQEMKERCFQQKEEIIRQQAQKLRQKQWQVETEILEKDLREMEPEQAEMFRKMQRDIWAKWQKEGTLPF